MIKIFQHWTRIEDRLPGNVECRLYILPNRLYKESKSKIQYIRIHPNVRRKKNVLMVPFPLCHYGEQWTVAKYHFRNFRSFFFYIENAGRWKIPHSAVYGVDQRKRHSRYCVIIVITITRQYRKQSFTDSNILFPVLISFVSSFHSLQPSNGKWLKKNSFILLFLPISWSFAKRMNSNLGQCTCENFDLRNGNGIGIR